MRGIRKRGKVYENAEKYAVMHVLSCDRSRSGIV